MSLSQSQTVYISHGASTVTFKSPNTFIYKLPSSGIRTSNNNEVALKSMTVYYSWPNISAMKGNNRFSYTWPLSTGTQTFDVIFADGIYQFLDMRDYLQQTMKSRGHYLLDSNGSPVYYIDFVVNTVLYCLSLTCTPLPAALPTGYSYPSNWQATSALTPQLIVPSGWSKVSGFPVNTYPTIAQASIYQVNSGVPQITDATSINIVSNIVNNSNSLSPEILTTFTVETSKEPGTLINLSPNNIDWLPLVKDNTITEIRISLTDQLGNPIEIKDPAGFVCILNMRRSRGI